jgi:hypothetical protein
MMNMTGPVIFIIHSAGGQMNFQEKFWKTFRMDLTFGDISVYYPYIAIYRKQAISEII